MVVYCDASEEKSSSESIVIFPGVKNVTVGSISVSVMKRLRWSSATLGLEALMDWRISNGTGIVIPLLIVTTVVVISIVLCV